MKITVGGKSFTWKVEYTTVMAGNPPRERFSNIDRTVGTVTFTKPGIHELTLQPQKIVGDKVIVLKRIQLVPKP
jgi:hypothetical protein